MLILPATVLSLTPTGLAWKQERSPQDAPDSSVHFAEYLLSWDFFFLLRELGKRVTHCAGALLHDLQSLSHPLLPRHLTKSVSCAGQTDHSRSERWGNRVREERTCPDHHRLGNATLTLVQWSASLPLVKLTAEMFLRRLFFMFENPMTEKPLRATVQGAFKESNVTEQSRQQ